MAPQSALAAGVAEPPWPAKCPLKVGLFLDRSTSLEAGFGDVQQASKDLVDSLRNRPSQVLVAGFGTTASVVQPLTDVSETPGRRAVKKAISNLTTFDDDSGQGATNWESALQLAEAADVQVAVIVTDGIPNAYGNPIQQADASDDRAVAAARVVANRLKKSGTRVVPVGIDLGEGGVENLQAISGPKIGDDYFVTQVNVLRGELYQIAAKSCGVPVAALPTPEPPAFPLRAVIISVVIGGLVLVLAALAVNRLRQPQQRPRPSSGVTRPGPVRDELIRVSDVSGGLAASEFDTAEGDKASFESPPANPGRSMSLDFLRRSPDEPPANR